jgi:hypothetical protein
VQANKESQEWRIDRHWRRGQGEAEKRAEQQQLVADIRGWWCGILERGISNNLIAKIRGTMIQWRCMLKVLEAIALQLAICKKVACGRRYINS